MHLAFDEIRLAGAGSPQVARRIKAALTDLRSIAPPERVGIIDLELDLLSTATEAAFSDERDVKPRFTKIERGLAPRPARSTAGRSRHHPGNLPVTGSTDLSQQKEDRADEVVLDLDTEGRQPRGRLRSEA